VVLSKQMKNRLQNPRRPTLMSRFPIWSPATALQLMLMLTS
jgi:hypothetical protein